MKINCPIYVPHILIDILLPSQWFQKE